jgi:hypothetical protein
MINQISFAMSRKTAITEAVTNAFKINRIILFIECAMNDFTGESSLPS